MANTSELPSDDGFTSGGNSQCFWGNTWSELSRLGCSSLLRCVVSIFKHLNSSCSAQPLKNTTTERVCDYWCHSRKVSITAFKKVTHIQWKLIGLTALFVQTRSAFPRCCGFLLENSHRPRFITQYLHLYHIWKSTSRWLQSLGEISVSASGVTKVQLPSRV